MASSLAAPSAFIVFDRKVFAAIRAAQPRSVSHCGCDRPPCSRFFLSDVVERYVPEEFFKELLVSNVILEAAPAAADLVRAARDALARPLR